MDGMELRRLEADGGMVSMGCVMGSSEPTGYLRMDDAAEAVELWLSPEEMTELARMLKDCAQRVEEFHETEGWS